MARHIRITLLWLLGMLALAGLAAAQGGGGIKIDSVDTGDYPNLAVLASVLDQNGIPVTDLSKTAFEIVEDGRSSFPPEEVSTQINPDARVSIALILDLSGSMRGKPLEQAKAASVQLMDALLDVEGDADRVAVFGLKRPVAAGDMTYDQALEFPFGNNKTQALALVDSLTIDENRPTPLYDALFRAVKLASGQEGRRAIIVISDGIDSVSKLKADDPIAEANRSHIPIFPISLSTNKVDKDYLQRLAVRTGGVYREAPSPDEFSPLFQQVLDQLKLQYKLSYASRVPNDEATHSVLVRVRSPQAEGFDEVKFSLAAPPAAEEGAAGTTTAGESAATAGETSVPTTTPEAGTSEGLADDVRTFVTDNPVPSALIGAAALLALLLIVLIFVWWRRRPSEPEPVAGFGGAAAPEGRLPRGPVAANLPATEAGTLGNQTLPPGGAPPGTAPTAGPGYAAPAFWGGPSAPPAGAPPPAPGAPPAAGGTRVIAHGPKHTAVLVSVTTPGLRYDVLAETSIGRSQENTIHLNSAMVSRQHARIRQEDDVFLLFDLGSANGTTVNGEPVIDPRPLHDGDVVAFGDVKFTFRQLS